MLAPVPTPEHSQVEELIPEDDIGIWTEICLPEEIAQFKNSFHPLEKSLFSKKMIFTDLPSEESPSKLDDNASVLMVEELPAEEIPARPVTNGRETMAA